MAEFESVVFSRSNFSDRSFELFRDMKKRADLCDVTFRIGDVSILAHRVILAAAIPYFRKLYSREDLQMGEISVELPHVDPNSFESLVEFAYSGEVIITTQNVKNLLKTAHKLSVDEVREACCDFLMGRLQPEEVLDIRELACNIECLELQQDVDLYITENFMEVSQMKKFEDLPFVYLNDILGKDELCVSSEEKVFEAAINWVEKCLEDRKNNLPELMSKVRMPLLSKLYLKQNVDNEELFNDSIQCKNLLLELKNFHLYEEDRPSVCSFSLKPRRISENLEDPVSSKYLAVNLCYASCAKLRDKIYYFSNGNVFQYESSHECCKRVTLIPNPRTYASAVSFENRVYLCGGKNVFRSDTNIVGCYDPETNEWTNIACMREKRSASCAVLLRNNIYVLGGHNNGENILSSVERYDSIQKKWKRSEPMLFKRSFFGCAELEDRIYACGGISESVFGSAESYDPVSNEWTFITSMNNNRWGYTLDSNCGKLYAFGGLDINSETFSTMEIYNPETGEWELPTSFESQKQVVYCRLGDLVDYSKLR